MSIMFLALECLEWYANELYETVTLGITVSLTSRVERSSMQIIVALFDVGNQLRNISCQFLGLS